MLTGKDNLMRGLGTLFFFSVGSMLLLFYQHRIHPADMGRYVGWDDRLNHPDRADSRRRSALVAR